MIASKIIILRLYTANKNIKYISLCIFPSALKIGRFDGTPCRLHIQVTDGLIS
mgnify:CR=1 FL=1